jgi:hypothetical protein
MSKAKSTFRKTDFKRAILAAESAGMKVGRVEVDTSGKITLIPDNGEDREAERPSGIIL